MAEVFQQIKAERENIIHTCRPPSAHANILGILLAGFVEGKRREIQSEASSLLKILEDSSWKGYRKHIFKTLYMRFQVKVNILRNSSKISL